MRSKKAPHGKNAEELFIVRIIGSQCQLFVLEMIFFIL